MSVPNSGSLTPAAQLLRLAIFWRTGRYPNNTTWSILKKHAAGAGCDFEPREKAPESWIRGTARLITAGMEEDRKEREHLLVQHLLSLRPSKGAVAAATVGLINPTLLPPPKTKPRPGAWKTEPLPWLDAFQKNPRLQQANLENPPYAGMVLRTPSLRGGTQVPVWAWSRWQARRIIEVKGFTPGPRATPAPDPRWNTKTVTYADPSIKSDLLAAAASDGDVAVRLGAAANVRTTRATLDELISDPDPRVRSQAAANPLAITCPMAEHLEYADDDGQGFAALQEWYGLVDELLGQTRSLQVWPEQHRKLNEVILDSVRIAKARSE